MQKLIRIRRKWMNREIEAVIIEDNLGGISGNDQLIRVGRDEQQIYIDTPVDDFEERCLEIIKTNLPKGITWTFGTENADASVKGFEESVVSLLKDNLPKELTWSFKAETIYSLVGTAIRQTLQQVIKEIKKETICSIIDPIVRTALKQVIKEMKMEVKSIV